MGEVTAVHVARAPAPRVVVGGAGPAGLMAALEARRHGLDVLVMERRSMAEHGTRQRVVALDAAAERAIRATGAGSAAFDGARGITGSGRITTVQIGHLERALLERARHAGVEVRFDTPLARQQPHEIVIDARGRSGSSAHDDLGIGGRQLQLPFQRQRRLTIADVDTLPARESELTRGERHRERIAGERRRAFSYAVPRHVSLSVETPPGASDHEARSAIESAARRRGIDATRIANTTTLELTPSIPSRISRGRAMRIGDAAGTVHPVTGQGITLGIADAQRAAARAARIAAGQDGIASRLVFTVPSRASHTAAIAAGALVTASNRAVAGGAVLAGAATALAAARSSD